MTKDKDFKRLVRRRMQKTDESYTTARSHLLRNDAPAVEGASTRDDGSAGPGTSPPDAASTPPGSDHDLPEGYESLAGMSDEAVRAKTGRDWPGWTRTLDGVGATSMAHRQIAAHLRGLELPAWWAQMVAVGYERIRGLRDVGQRRDGSYEISRSRTLPVPVAELYRAWRDESLRDRWLDRSGLEIRAATEDRSLRIALDDGTRVEVSFDARDEARSTVTVEHRKLPDREHADRAKAFWERRLEALKAFFNGS